MRCKLLIVFIIAHLSCFSQSVQKLHNKSTLVDTHNDVLSSQVLDGVDISHRNNIGHTDLDRLKDGGVDVQFFSVWTDKTPRNAAGFFKDANQEIDSLELI